MFSKSILLVIKAQIKSKVANEDERPYFYIASYLTLYKQELRTRLNKT